MGPFAARPEEPIRHVCKGCDAALSFRPQRAGQSEKCPQCDTEIVVPEAAVDTRLPVLFDLLFCVLGAMGAFYVVVFCLALVNQGKDVWRPLTHDDLFGLLVLVLTAVVAGCVVGGLSCLLSRWFVGRIPDVWIIVSAPVALALLAGGIPLLLCVGSMFLYPLAMLGAITGGGAGLGISASRIWMLLHKPKES
jgi:hypothetical protein